MPHLTPNHRCLGGIVDQSFLRCSPERPERGEIRSCLEEVRLPCTICPDKHIDAGIWFDTEFTVRAEISELEPGELHSDADGHQQVGESVVINTTNDTRL